MEPFDLSLDGFSRLVVVFAIAVVDAYSLADVIVSTCLKKDDD